MIEAIPKANCLPEVQLVSAKEVISAMRTAVDAVKDQNQGMISADALLTYLNTLDAQADRINEIDRHEGEVNLANFRAEHERNLAHYQAEVGHHTEMARATISFGRDALRSATLINGGAAVALLAFIGNIWTKGIEPEASNVLTLSILYFACGVLAGALGTGASYVTQFCYFLKLKKAWAVHLITGAIVFGAVVFFCLGAYNSYLAFTKHLGKAPPPVVAPKTAPEAR